MKLLSTVWLLAWAATIAQAESSGWTLVTPTYGKETVLLDDSGRESHLWKGEFNNGGGSRLLPDGAILKVVDMPKEETFAGSVAGGGLEIVEWNGDVRWRFWTAVTHEMNVVDAILLPNGNVLAVTMEWKSREEAEKAGRDPAVLDAKGFLVPALVEYRPRGKSAGVPVWKWSLWNHIYQQKHPALEGYSFPKAKPGCIDIGENPTATKRLWLRAGGISYNLQEDLVIYTLEGLKEPLLIDHSTTMAEAAADQGGKRGHGGRVLNRLSEKDASKNGPARDAFVYAEWMPDHPGGKADYLVLDHAGGHFRTLRVPVGEDWTSAAEARLLSLQWPSDSANAKASWIGFTPRRLVSAGDDKWVVFEKGLGTVAFVDAGQKSRIWTYQNEHGKRKFVPRPEGADADSCCGGSPPASSAPAKNLPVKEMAPVNSVHHYASDYLVKPANG